MPDVPNVAPMDRGKKIKIKKNEIYGHVNQGYIYIYRERERVKTVSFVHGRQFFVFWCFFFWMNMEGTSMIRHC